jgi:hypothetical protein
MTLGLPGEVEHAVSILDDAALFDLHADGNQRSARRVERLQAFAPHAGIEGLQSTQNGCGAEPFETGLRLRLIVVEREQQLITCSTRRMGI